MRTRISLRWRLILVSWSLAFGIALALTVLLQVRARRHLLQQLEKNLETRCAEVVTVLESGASYPMLRDFLHIETTNAPTYFYVIRDTEGSVLARGENLAGLELPVPAGWHSGDAAPAATLRTEPHPVSPQVDRILVRSERVRITPAGREPTMAVIQTAVCLRPFESTIRGTLRDAALVAVGGLAGVFFLLWFVTTRSLLPVAAMTRKASQITATSFRERLPVSGNGDELDELAEVLNDMLERLGRSLRQMEQFSSDAAHQLRTPLTRIRGELDLVLRSDFSEPSRSQLERIREELEQMSRLCGRLLLLARLDQQAGAPGLLVESVDLEELVGEVLEQMTPAALERGVELQRGAASAARVRGSRPLLVEALLNLLDNAIRYTPPGRSVVVSTSTSGGQVQLSVEDGGPGIPPEERERVFQRFYRLPQHPAASDGGAGLGLAIVSGIAKAHRGRLELSEAPHGGSVFRLVLLAHSGSEG